MSTKPEFVEKALELLDPLNVTAKPMFGEYGLYLNGKLFGLICDNTFFIKVTDEGSKIAGKIGKDSPYPGAKPAFKISAARLRDELWLKQLVEITAKALPAPKLKKKSGL
jgi:TfoX/Sxy family transcriptional regulator of competence genes